MGDSRTHHKMVEAETSLGWFREPGHICYQNETTKFCGVEEDCYIGMALPFINESTWDWRVRAVLYLVGTIDQRDPEDQGLPRLHHHLLLLHLRLPLDRDRPGGQQ